MPSPKLSPARARDYDRQVLYRTLYPRLAAILIERMAEASIPAPYSDAAFAILSRNLRRALDDASTAEPLVADVVSVQRDYGPTPFVHVRLSVRTESPTESQSRKRVARPRRRY